MKGRFLAFGGLGVKDIGFWFLGFRVYPDPLSTLYRPWGSPNRSYIDPILGYLEGLGRD